jgi:hypothetical protein
MEVKRGYRQREVHSAEMRMLTSVKGCTGPDKISNHDLRPEFEEIQTNKSMVTACGKN